MFEKATRLKLRFSTPQGNLSIEELWDLPLTSTRNANLDDIARGLFKAIKERDEVESFVVKPAKKDETVQLAFDIVKHIIEVRMAENEAAALRKSNKEKQQRLLEIISKKQDEKDANKSLEELKGELEAMQAQDA